LCPTATVIEPELIEQLGLTPNKLTEVGEKEVAAKHEWTRNLVSRPIQLAKI